RRCLLSAAYTDASVWEQRKKETLALSELAATMDQTFEKSAPVSSLVIARFVDNISSPEEVGQAEYYLYKFRHCSNCYYLRDWTIHSWIRQCFKYGMRDRALYTVKNKVQFGIFPDNFTFNLLIDSFLKDKDYKEATSIVEEVMLQEAFELVSTQMLSLSALSKYLATKPELSWEEEKTIGTSLFLVGLTQKNTVGFSTRLLGLALIGKVELSRGIHKVYHRLPLIWTSGYLKRALSVMETLSSDFRELSVSADVVDGVEQILRDLSVLSDRGWNEGMEKSDLMEEDTKERLSLSEYIQRFNELKQQLQAQNQIDSRSLESLVSLLTEENLPLCEEADLNEYHQKLKSWDADRQQLLERETKSKSREKAEDRTAERGQQ
ncbi:hypothetical protein DNTS_014535, partial [Danionella cerebrum]